MAPLSSTTAPPGNATGVAISVLSHTLGLGTCESLAQPCTVPGSCVKVPAPTGDDPVSTYVAKETVAPCGGSAAATDIEGRLRLPAGIGCVAPDARNTLSRRSTATSSSPSAARTDPE